MKAQWYDPREGTWQAIGQFPKQGTREFIPPAKGPQSDWVLVVEDAGKRLPTK